MKSSLLEVEYEDIFRPETMAALKGKSGESLRAMLGNKQLMKAILDSRQFLDNVVQIESDYKIELEMIAEIMAREAYPILDYANVKIDAKLSDDISQNDSNDEDDEESPAEFAPEEKKRRIINGITHGASVRGTFSFFIIS